MDDQLLFPPLPPVPPSPFLSLTPELKQAIFSALPDTTTLKSVVLTCSLFYRTFLDAAPLIVKSILHTQIGSDLIYDALVVFTSSALESYSDNAARELLELYARHDPTCLSQISKLRDALAIGDLHDKIDFFVRGFVSSALSANPVTGFVEASPSPPSMQESNRIKRAFYRYELFYNIFRTCDPFQDVNPRTPQSIFFSMCAPWENEQLACVRDYLYESLSLPFNDVAEHDIEWGELKIRYLDLWDVRNDYWKECYLSLGLTCLHQIVNTFTYEDRCHVLKAHKEDLCYSLFYAFSDAPDEQSYGNGLAELETYTEEDELIYITAQFAIDDDKGPEKAWRWAYADSTHGYWYNIDSRWFLRERAYVMWDFTRLAQWGLLDHDWKWLPHESFSNEYNIRCENEMRDTFKARHEIWLRGGRGWWSAGDESRIVWHPPAPENDLRGL